MNLLFWLPLMPAHLWRVLQRIIARGRGRLPQQRPLLRQAFDRMMLQAPDVTKRSAMQPIGRWRVRRRMTMMIP